MADCIVSVKAFIMDENKNLLIIKRAKTLEHKPGVWELPGGKMNPNDDPSLSLLKEVKEETALKINILFPLSVRHFTKEDGEIMTMLVFYCNPINKKVKLCKRHESYEWISLKDAEKKLSKFFYHELVMYGVITKLMNT